MSNQNQKLACSTLREAAKMLRLKDCGAHATQCDNAAEKLEKEIAATESIVIDVLKELTDIKLEEFAESGVFGRFSE